MEDATHVQEASSRDPWVTINARNVATTKIPRKRKPKIRRCVIVPKGIIGPKKRRVAVLAVMKVSWSGVQEENLEANTYHLSLALRTVRY
jgi:hypothetical protein